MNHDELVKYVRGMKLQELTPSTFDGFVMDAIDIFLPTGSLMGVHLRVGKNERSVGQFGEHAFSGNNRPNWDVFGGRHEIYRNAIVSKFEVRKGKQKEDSRFLFVDFAGSYTPYETFGTNRERPLKFAFDEGKALYIAEQSENGTLEYPYESLFIRK